MEKCLQCSKELKHIPGRKQKSFCNVNCRNKYFYAQRKKNIELAKSALQSLPHDYMKGIKNIGILTKDGQIQPIFETHKKPIGGNNKPTEANTQFSEIKPPELLEAPRKPIVFKSAKEYDKLIPITNKTPDLKLLLVEILASPLSDKDKKAFESRINFKIIWNEKTP